MQGQKYASKVNLGKIGPVSPKLLKAKRSAFLTGMRPLEGAAAGNVRGRHDAGAGISEQTMDGSAFVQRTRLTKSIKRLIPRPACSLCLVIVGLCQPQVAGLASLSGSWLAPTPFSRATCKGESAVAPPGAVRVDKETCGSASTRLRLRGGLGSWGVQDFGISSADQANLVKLREFLAPEIAAMGEAGQDYQSDERMFRVYRTSGCSIDASVKYFRGMIEWRKKVGADPIRQAVLKEWREDFWAMPCVPKKEIFKKWYMFHPNHAETAEGELVSTESTGYIKIRSLIKGLNRQDILRFWCCWMEWTQIKLTQLSKKHNRISRMVQIKDLAGLNLYQVSSKPAMGHFKQVNRMLHDMYPDTLNTLIMINTPKIFSAIWKMFKPLLPKKTQGKIKMVETGSAEQTKTLQLHLPPSDPLLECQSTSQVYHEQPEDGEPKDQDEVVEMRLAMIKNTIIGAFAGFALHTNRQSMLRAASSFIQVVTSVVEGRR